MNANPSNIKDQSVCFSLDIIKQSSQFDVIFMSKLTKFKLDRILGRKQYFRSSSFLYFRPSVRPFGQFFGRPVFYLFGHLHSAVRTSSVLKRSVIFLVLAIWPTIQIWLEWYCIPNVFAKTPCIGKYLKSFTLDLSVSSW